MNKLAILGWLAKWLLLKQGLGIKIVDKVGKENVVAEILSCLQVPDDPATIDYSFLDEYLFSLSTRNTWYADIANYLAIVRTPAHSPKERRLLAEKSSNLS